MKRWWPGSTSPANAAGYALECREITPMPASTCRCHTAATSVAATVVDHNAASPFGSDPATPTTSRSRSHARRRSRSHASAGPQRRNTANSRAGPIPGNPASAALQASGGNADVVTRLSPRARTGRPGGSARARGALHRPGSRRADRRSSGQPHGRARRHGHSIARRAAPIRARWSPRR